MGSSELVSGWGPLECTMGRSSDLASGRVGSSIPEGWIELTSLWEGFAQANVGSFERTALETTRFVYF